MSTVPGSQGSLQSELQLFPLCIYIGIDISPRSDSQGHALREVPEIFNQRSV